MPTTTAPRRTILLVLAALYLCLLPLILSNYDVGRAYFDQVEFHLPTVMQIAERGFDFRDYRSATTPGYHVLLAGVAKFVSAAEIPLKLAGSLFTAVLFAWFAALLSVRLGTWHVVALLLPAVVSIYMLPSGVWLLPDNLGWLTVLFTLVICLELPDRPERFWLAALGLAATIFVRQPNVWLAAPIFVALLLPAAPATRLSFSTAGVVRAVLAVVPGLAVLVAFYLLWGALVPPAWAQRHQAFNFAVPAFLLTVFGFYSLFFLPYVGRRLLQVWADPAARRWIWLGLAVGVVLAVLPETDYNSDAGRLSGLWSLAKIPPVIAHRSIVLLILSAWGGAACAAWLMMVPWRSRLILLAGLIVFAAAQTANHLAYERYYAGLVFILIVLILREAAITASARWKMLGPLAFALFNAVALVFGMLKPG